MRLEIWLKANIDIVTTFLGLVLAIVLKALYWQKSLKPGLNKTRNYFDKRIKNAKKNNDSEEAQKYINRVKDVLRVEKATYWSNLYCDISITTDLMLVQYADDILGLLLVIAVTMFIPIFALFDIGFFKGTRRTNDDNNPDDIYYKDKVGKKWTAWLLDLAALAMWAVAMWYIRGN